MLTDQDQAAIAFENLLSFGVKTQLSADAERLLALIDGCLEDTNELDLPEETTLFRAARELVVARRREREARGL